MAEKMVTVKVTFTVPEYGIELEQFGGNDNGDKGDALKGATTDALTKIGSYLGIGQDVWKNKKPQINQATGEIVENKEIPAKKVTRKTPAQVATKEMVEEWANTGAFQLAKGISKTNGRPWFAVEAEGTRWWIQEETYNFLLSKVKAPALSDPNF